MPDVVPIDAEDLEHIIEGYMLSDDASLVIHLTPEHTRVEVEAIAHVLARYNLHEFKDTSGYFNHFFLDSMWCGKKTQPALFKNLGRSSHPKDNNTAYNHVLCLWTTLGYST